VKPKSADNYVGRPNKHITLTSKMSKSKKQDKLTLYSFDGRNSHFVLRSSDGMLMPFGM